MLHDAYSFAPDFEAELVQRILDRLSPDHRSTILDPFCGTGTTLLESKMHGLSSVGVDANPVCVLVSRAKTYWGLDISRTREMARRVVGSALIEYASFIRRYKKARASGARWMAQSAPIFARSAPGTYLISSGLIRRGWISTRPALKTLLVAERLWKISARARDFLLLCLLGLLVPEVSNMSYGPEIYRARRRIDRDVFGLFERRVEENLKKLEGLKPAGTNASTDVRLGDSANGGLRFLEPNSIDVVLTSPPYLSDHDYSRLTRLELVFSGHVASAKDLRNMKQRLLRSSSKNVYKDDHATELVERFSIVRSTILAVSERAIERRSGFARVYPKLVGEYFGGMYKHFQALGRVLRLGGRAAYIVGDQSSFFATPIPTAAIIAQLAEKSGAGLRVVSKEAIKKYRGTRGAVSWSNQEWLLLLEKRTRTSV